MKKHNAKIVAEDNKLSVPKTTRPKILRRELKHVKFHPNLPPSEIDGFADFYYK